ncbi:MAG: hypothetical protein ABEJ02_03730 [Candidatus Paceibacteria bacterium]
MANIQEVESLFQHTIFSFKKVTNWFNGEVKTAISKPKKEELSETGATIKTYLLFRHRINLRTLGKIKEYSVELKTWEEKLNQTRLDSVSANTIEQLKNKLEKWS